MRRKLALAGAGVALLPELGLGERRPCACHLGGLSKASPSGGRIRRKHYDTISYCIHLQAYRPTDTLCQAYGVPDAPLQGGAGA